MSQIAGGFFGFWFCFAFFFPLLFHLILPIPLYSF